MKIKYHFSEEFYKEETVPFVIDSQKKRLWAVLLDLLFEFDRVCRKYSIKYSIDGGTMLGKVRHNGFIPWDDDVDVIIMRSEYEKLLKVADQEFKEPYFFQTMFSDPEAVRGHPQLRNSSTTGILKVESKNGKAIYKTFNQGIFLDIFVLDAIPDVKREREKYFKELTHLKEQMIRARSARRDKIVFSSEPKEFLQFLRVIRNKICMKFFRLFKMVDPLPYYIERFDRACKRYINCKTCDVSHISLLPMPPNSRIFEREKIQETVEVDFHGLKVQMLKEWEYYLSNLYGDWHKYVIGAAIHGGLVIDVDKPYTEYF
jgi:lipopolysaccharide cholinephosphotransferase